MKIDNILKLAALGYTKEEIDRILSEDDTGASNIPETPAEKPGPEKEPAIETKNEPAAKPITMSEDQFKTLIQNLAVNTASGKVELPPSIDETLASHYAAILKGE